MGIDKHPSGRPSVFTFSLFPPRSCLIPRTADVDHDIVTFMIHRPGLLAIVVHVCDITRHVVKHHSLCTARPLILPHDLPHALQQVCPHLLVAAGVVGMESLRDVLEIPPCLREIDARGRCGSGWSRGDVKVDPERHGKDGGVDG